MEKEGIMMKTLLFRSFVGICFGALVMVLTCFGVIGFGDVTSLDSGIFVKNAIGCLLCGWFFSTATILFEIEKWSLLSQTILHFLTVSILYCFVRTIMESCSVNKQIISSALKTCCISSFLPTKYGRFLSFKRSINSCTSSFHS
ncbi:DUF3021 domain-containing protein [Peribacillus sp. FSL K6-1552]|uniref:DUF3021 domain-containing protein n=1 Tax=Peribacillus sp. FSL K6-1552 TaxID=2954514 RepID=UPI004046F1F6